jgi:hypothetical protein
MRIRTEPIPSKERTDGHPRKFSFAEYEGSFMCLHEPATGSLLEPDESIKHSHTLISLKPILISIYYPFIDFLICIFTSDFQITILYVSSHTIRALFPAHHTHSIILSS